MEVYEPKTTRYKQVIICTAKIHHIKLSERNVAGNTVSDQEQSTYFLTQLQLTRMDLTKKEKASTPHHQALNYNQTYQHTPTLHVN